jgi:hypothetical protein
MIHDVVGDKGDSKEWIYVLEVMKHLGMGRERSLMCMGWGRFHSLEVVICLSLPPRPSLWLESSENVSSITYYLEFYFLPVAGSQ